MRKKLSTIGISLFIGSFVALLSFGFLFSGIVNNTNISYQTIIEEVQNGDAVFLDVRTVYEYNTDGYFAHTENYPYVRMKKTLPEVDKDTKIYLHCLSGGRSAKAAELLKDAGFNDVVDLGGLDDVLALDGAKDHWMAMEE